MENFTLQDLAAILFGVVVFVVVSMLLEDGGRRARTLYAFIMSRPRSLAPADSVPELVPVPVAATGSSEVVPIEPTVQLPDTTAPNDGTDDWEQPRISRYLDDRASVVMLATQKRGGKYRFSANQIVQISGGNRGDVLSVIRAVREQPAPFPERTPEQQATRQALGL